MPTENNMEEIQFQKANPATLKRMEEESKLMTTPELVKLQETIEELIEERDRQFMTQTMSKEQLLDLYHSRGYSPKKGDKFWKIRSPEKGRGFYGWEVGRFEHSCHIDTTDLIVLYVIEPRGSNGSVGESYVEEYADLWLEGPIVV